MAQLKEALQSVAALNNRVLFAYGEDDLFDQTKTIIKPCVGIVYEGMRPQPEGDKTTHRVGISNDSTFTFVLVMDSKFLGLDQRTAAIRLLDDLRAAVRAQNKNRSATGHFWRFAGEFPAGEKNGTVVWLQRWANPIQLV